MTYNDFLQKRLDRTHGQAFLRYIRYNRINHSVKNEQKDTCKNQDDQSRKNSSNNGCGFGEFFTKQKERQSNDRSDQCNEKGIEKA